MKKVIGLAIVLVLMFSMSASAFWGHKGKKFKHADMNKDGKVDAKEMWMQKAWDYQQGNERACKVNTRLERKYDADGNGWLDNQEARNMLRARYRYMKRRRMTKVDNPFEAKFDINSNGYIDTGELQALKDAIQE